MMNVMENKILGPAIRKGLEQGLKQGLKQSRERAAYKANRSFSEICLSRNSNHYPNGHLNASSPPQRKNSRVGPGGFSPAHL